jgi:Fuc2NAc and GlcNAc transferase
MTVFSLDIGTLVVAFAFLLALVSTGFYRHWAIKVNIIDRPNERSSHVRPTPRGGGAALVFSCAITYLLLFFFGKNLTLFEPAFLAVLFAFGIAILGFFDDRFNLSVRLRFGLQICFSVLSVLIIYRAYPGSDWMMAVLAVFFLIWMTNLYNFMDGIDGLAAGQVATVSLKFALLYFLQGEGGFEVHYLLLAAVALAFLVWNWHPAKIFMGDVGSCFFGFILAVLAIWSYFSGTMPLPVLLILHMSFIFDTTYTLIVRGLRKQKIYSAHRDHTYQHAVQAGYRHSSVSLIYMAINVFWLLPLGYQSLIEPGWAWALVILSTLPLLVGAVYFKAGIKPQ